MPMTTAFAPTGPAPSTLQEAIAALLGQQGKYPPGSIESKFGFGEPRPIMQETLASMPQPAAVMEPGHAAPLPSTMQQALSSLPQNPGGIQQPTGGVPLTPTRSTAPEGAQPQQIGEGLPDQL